MSDRNLEARFGAGNYAPLPVTVVRGDGVYLWDDQGRRYIDMMGAYSAVSFGLVIHGWSRLLRRRRGGSTPFPAPISTTGSAPSWRARASLPAWTPHCP